MYTVFSNGLETAKPGQVKQETPALKLEISTLEELKNSCIDDIKSVYNDMSTLQSQREESFNAYLSKPYGNEVDGRSKFVTSDLSDVVESIMPSLMRTFYGNKNVVSIQPVGVEDELASRLMEQKVNYDFTVGLNGYKILDTWFRDALFQKIGVVKYYWLKEEEYKSKEYDDLTEAEYMNLLQQEQEGRFIIDKEEVETKQEAVVDETGVVITPAHVSYSVEGRKVVKISKPIVENIPPEEFIFPINARSVETAEFCAHKKRVHKTYVRKYGVTEVDIENEASNYNNDVMYQARFEDIGGVQFFQDVKDPDYIYIYECYKDYYDQKGKKTPYKIVIMGNKVIDAEENRYGKAPFCVLTCLPVPHRMVGRDLADLVKPIQELHSFYIRYINDNLSYQNLGMRIVNPFRVQMDDVLNENAPGGIWRTKYDIDPSRCALPITPTPLSPEVYNLVELMDNMRQERTGVTKYQSGMDSKSLNRTAYGISQIMNAALQRVELIARSFAEDAGGVKGMFQALVDLNLDFFDNEVSIKLNQEWINITPDAIDGRFDIMVDVGSAMGTAEIQVNQMMQMLQNYQMLKQGGTPIPPKYELAIVREIWNKWGYKNVDQFAPADMATAVKDVQEGMQMMQAMQMQQQMPQQIQPPQGGSPNEML